MASFLDRLLRLWVEPPADGVAAEAAFREVYADPVLVNGSPLSSAGMVDRSRALHRAFDDVQLDLLDVVEAPERMVVAFVLRGRHVGPLATPIGIVPPTGLSMRVRTIDVLTVVDERVTRMWVVADEFGMLQHLDAIALAAARPAGPVTTS
jgi:predicted ester cyclase